MPLCDAKSLNKKVKKKGLPLFQIGMQNLQHFGLDNEFISILVALVDAFGISLLLNWDPQGHCYRIDIFGKHVHEDIPKSAYQLFEINSSEQGAYQKFNLINTAENLLDFYQQKIMIKNKKLRSDYENALMRITIAQLYDELSAFNTPITAYRLLHQMLLSHLFKENYYFINQIKPLLREQTEPLTGVQGPWILLAQDITGKAFTLVGELEAQLIYYLLESDFLQHYQLNVAYSIDMRSGWGAVIEKQCAYSHRVLEKTQDAVKEYRAMQIFDEQFIQHSYRIKAHQLEKLLTSKKTLEIEWATSPKKVQKLLINELKLIDKHCARLHKQMRNLARESVQITGLTDQRIFKHLKQYPEYLQPIPENLLIHYFYEYRQHMQQHGVLSDLQKQNVTDLLAFDEKMQNCIPHDIQAAMTQAPIPAHSIEPAGMMQINLMNNSIAQVRKKILAPMDSAEPMNAIEYADSVETITVIEPAAPVEIASQIDALMDYPIESIAPQALAMTALVEAIEKANAKTALKKNKKHKEIIKDFNKVVLFIETYSEHKQKIPSALLDFYMHHFEEAMLNDAGTTMNSLSLLIEHAPTLQYPISDLVMTLFLDQLGQQISNADSENQDQQYRFHYERLKKVQVAMNSGVLDQWLAEKAKQYGKKSVGQDLLYAMKAFFKRFEKQFSEE